MWPACFSSVRKQKQSSCVLCMLSKGCSYTEKGGTPSPAGAVTPQGAGWWLCCTAQVVLVELGLMQNGAVPSSQRGLVLENALVGTKVAYCSLDHAVLRVFAFQEYIGPVLVLIGMRMGWKQLNPNIWWCLWFPADAYSLSECDMRFASNDKSLLITMFLQPENRNDITLVFDLENMNGMCFEFARFLGFDNMQIKSRSIEVFRASQNEIHVLLSSCVSNVSNSRQAGSDEINIYLINTSVYSV